MAVKRSRYRVDLEDGSTLEVEVRHGDRLRGELEANRWNLPNAGDAPLNATTIWIWCAAVREGKVDRTVAYPTFRDQVIELEPVKDDATGEALEPVDVPPTIAGPLSDSPAPSPVSTAADSTPGSTPIP